MRIVCSSFGAGVSDYRILLINNITEIKFVEKISI